MRAERHRVRLAVRLLSLGLACGLGWTAAAPVAAEDDAEPVFAVLPFRVNSARPIEYLGESLADLIRARLEASGGARVVSASAVAGAGADADARPDALRALAEEVGATHVVAGSLTELAGNFSLDVRITPAGAGQPSQTMVLTADEESELLDRVNELADRMLAETAGAPPSTVASVELLGAAGDLEILLESLLTRVGEPYEPATVRDDLAMLRSHPDVANASVESEPGDEGIAVRFRVVPTEAILGPVRTERSKKMVSAVQVRGNRRIESDAILARIGTRAGAPYSRAQVAKDVREVHALGFFRNVGVLTEETVGGLLVVFEVDENPVVRQISISGNDNVDGEKIRDILTITLGSALDYPLLFENRKRIEAIYRAEGYYLADVNYEIENLSEASVGIHFVVDEQEKLKLRKITFEGNDHFSDGDLREGFKTKRWRFWSYVTSWFDNSGTYSEPLFVQDLRLVEKRYTDSGFLQVQISEPDVLPDPKGLTVKVAVEEGRRFRVGAIDIAGDESVDSELLVQIVRLKEGDWFNRTQLTDDVAALTQHYTNRGFYFANVQPLSNLSEKEEQVDVIFEVNKGPLYFIRNIDIAGNTTTVDPVIRREVPIVEGQLYSQRGIMLARTRVQGLGFFEEVDFQVEPTQEQDQLDLEVSVVEKPTGSFSIGAGYSSQDSFVGTGSLAQDNLFGRGYSVEASADIGGQTQRFFLNLRDPYFMGSTFSLGVTGFLTNLRFESFEQEQIGAAVVLGHSLSEDNRSSGFLRYNFASREVTDSTNVFAASVILRELFQGSVTTSLLGLSLATDRRNDRLSPSKGYQATGSVEFAGIGGFTNFLRAEGRAAYYFGAPRWLLDRSTFVVAARVGYALPLNEISDYQFPAVSPLFQPSIDGNLRPLENIDDDLTLPLSERYFLGGLGQFQLRGFRARSVGPRRTLLRPNEDGAYLPVGRIALPVDINDPDVPLDPGEIDPGDPNIVLNTFCTGSVALGGDGDEDCNELDDDDPDEFADLDDTDVIGGNKFISTSLEYRFPISDTLGLQGLIFFDTGNAFAEGETLFDPTKWRYGTGGGIQWFSPFGPLAVILGFPLDALSVEKSPVFEFSVGGQNF